MSIIKKNSMFFIILTIVFLSHNRVHAQEGKQNDMIQRSATDLMIVVGAGVGGAILGLSTLSFAEKPRKNLRNIMYGGAIGIVAGVVIVAYNYATEAQQTDFSEDEARLFSPETTWRHEFMARSAPAVEKWVSQGSYLPSLSAQFSF